MFKTKSLSLLLIVTLILPVSAGGQQPLTQQEIRQVNKIRKKLGHYATGTMLVVRLNDGSHLAGALSQTGPTSFVLLNPVSRMPESIDYLNVKGVQLTRKEYASQTAKKTVNGLAIAAVAGALLIVVLVVISGGIHD